jgi:hypothetical protein
MDQTAIHFRWSLIHVNNQTSEDKFETDMAEVLKMTDKLESESPTMLSEHRDIIAALKKLIEAASAETQPNIVHFAERLMLHAKLRSKSPIRLCC